MDHENGRSLVWVLAQMRAMGEEQALEKIEIQLAQLGGDARVIYNGHETTELSKRIDQC
jgi:hypothetical protein